MSTAQMTKATKINGVDLTTLQALVDGVSAHPRNAIAKFAVSTAWKGGTRSETRVDGWELGGTRLPKSFKINCDEPPELCGGNSQPNPQEYLMAAFNACMMVGYVAGASMKGIRLDSVEIESEGELDLRGFLGLDSSIKPGYEKIHYTVRIKGDGSAEQFREIHETVIATSPNRWNIANPIRLTSDLVVE
jgi:uncharacterized OsmC-like protein